MVQLYSQSREQSHKRIKYPAVECKLWHFMIEYWTLNGVLM